MWPNICDVDLQPIDSSHVQILIGMDIVGAHQQLETRSPDTKEGVTAYPIRMGRRWPNPTPFSGWPQ